MTLIVLLIAGLGSAPMGKRAVELPQQRTPMVSAPAARERAADSPIASSLRPGALANGVTLGLLGVRSAKAQGLSLVPSFVSGGAVVGLETRF